MEMTVVKECKKDIDPGKKYSGKQKILIFNNLFNFHRLMKELQWQIYIYLIIFP